jgi:hypothetical protein
VSTPEQEPDLIVGRDGGEGYLTKEQKAWVAEENPDLAPYVDLKFRVSEAEEEPSKEAEDLASIRDIAATQAKENRRLRQQAVERDIAEEVEHLLDGADAVAETLDWEEADDFRARAQLEALNHVAAIENAELRQRTFRRLEDRVAPDLYEQFVQEWQQAYVEQTERESAEALARAEKEMDKQARVFASVVQLDTDMLNTLAPLEQACALKLLDPVRDEIAAMTPDAAQHEIRLRMEMARTAAAKMEEAHTQEQIIKAHGKTKSGPSGRSLREKSMAELGLLPELIPTEDEIEAAMRRSQKGVEVDRAAAQRVHRGSGPTGQEKLMAQQIALSKRLGIPVHDAATGRRLDT